MNGWILIVVMDWVAVVDLIIVLRIRGSWSCGGGSHSVLRIVVVAGMLRGLGGIIIVLRIAGGDRGASWGRGWRCVDGSLIVGPYCHVACCAVRIVV